MKLSWMKLDVNILSNEKIDLIRSMPDGDSIFIVWIGILCMAMKSRRIGCIFISDGVPYNPEQLAHILKVKVNTVKMALEMFSQFKMVEFDNEGCIMIPDFEDHQELKNIEHKRNLTRLRVEKHRQAQALLIGNDCNALQQNCNATEKKREDKIREEKKRKEKIIINKDEFDLWWNKYDKKCGKHLVIKKWNKLNNADYQRILSVVDDYVIANPDKQFRKDPLTYLNKRAWEDEIITKQQFQTPKEKQWAAYKAEVETVRLKARQEEIF